MINSAMICFMLRTHLLISRKKMSHPSQGKIQKYILRTAFDGYLPDEILYREKEQFADGIGSAWVTKLQSHAALTLPCLDERENQEAALYRLHLSSSRKQEQQVLLGQLIETRKARRRKNARTLKAGSAQSTRWHKVRHDAVLQGLNLSLDDAHKFLRNVLGWREEDITLLSHDVQSLNKLIVSMLSRIPFHNLTLLVRERRPPTPDEIRDDMMTGLGGPCSVVNSFFAILLDRLGFGPNIHILRY